MPGAFLYVAERIAVNEAGAAAFGRICEQRATVIPRAAALLGDLIGEQVDAEQRTPDRDRAGEHRVMAWVLAGLFAAGASLALLTVLLPHPSRLNVAGLLGVVGTAYLTAALLICAAGVVQGRVLQAALAGGSALITAAAYFSAGRPSPLIFFYLWIFLYSSYFFSTRQAAAQMVWVGGLFAALLAAAPPLGGASRLLWWLVGMGTLLVEALLIAAMRRRNDQLLARLDRMARHDALTELSNQRGFREALDIEVERAQRGGASMSLVVGDLDHFKQVNDRLGHPAGDAVLARVGAILDGGRRRIDTAARVGGEEFALILPGSDAMGAFVLAERLRQQVRDAFERDAVPITMSFGIAAYPAHGKSAESLLNYADEALYSAKRDGRDRTVIHGTPMSFAPARGLVV